MLYLPTALKECFTNKELRSLCIKPWLIGLASWIAAIITAIFFFDNVYSHLSLSSEAWYASVWNFIIWPVAALIMMLAAAIVATIVGLLFSAVYQGPIARYVLTQECVRLPEESATSSELMRVGKAEFLKLIWIIPLTLLLLVGGFIPLLAPVCFVIGAWIFAYQHVDIPLDELHLGAGKRLGYALRHFFKVALFGMVLGVVWPFIGLILQPVATAGASLLVARHLPGSIAEAQ